MLNSSGFIRKQDLTTEENRVANIKSQKKRNITNEKARKRNRAVKSELKTATRRVREAVAEGDGAKAYAETRINKSAPNIFSYVKVKQTISSIFVI